MTAVVRALTKVSQPGLPRVGEVAGWSPEGQPFVTFRDHPDKSFVARTTVPIPREGSAEVVVVFESNRLESPIIIGVLRAEPSRVEESVEDELTVRIDGDRLVFHAEQEIVLECGDARITLRDGRAVIEGAYVETYSRGVNRIKGAAVRIN